MASGVSEPRSTGSSLRFSVQLEVEGGQFGPAMKGCIRSSRSRPASRLTPVRRSLRAEEPVITKHGAPSSGQAVR